MNPRLIIVTESGGDLPVELCQRYGIQVVPMHVTIGDDSLDDGSFPVEDIFAYFDRTKKVPKTSATNPSEYQEMFESLHQAHPDATILHLCYSAVTTATWQNALIASEDMPYVRHVDTKNVAGGLAFILNKVGLYMEAHPDTTAEQLIPIVEDLAERTRFAFIPRDLSYLKAGGRVSNAAYIGATILNLKAMIELKDGHLVGTKKYRGNMHKVCLKATGDLIEQYQFDMEELYFVCSTGLEQSLKRELEQLVQSLGCKRWRWIPTGGVISCHGGPGAFGLIGLGRK